MSYGIKYFVEEMSDNSKYSNYEEWDYIETKSLDKKLLRKLERDIDYHIVNC